MADRKLKIALASSIPVPPASVNIYLDDVLIYENLIINNEAHDPYILEHTFNADTTHVLKFIMNNDYASEIEDLNLIIEYICLSDENFIYPVNTYLVNSEQEKIRIINDNLLVTDVLWGENGTFILNFDVGNPIVFIDNLPQPDGSTII